MTRFLVRTMVFFGLTALIVELFFRTVIPACEFPYMKTEDEYSLKVYDAKMDESGIYSRGNLNQASAPWNVNNDGWLSGIDYRPSTQRSKPCVVIIGSSYIEALLVGWEGHLANQLCGLLDDRYEVYALGMGGASMGAYINMARYAEQHYNPDILIFAYCGRDLAAAVANYSRDPSELQLKHTGNGFEELPPKKYVASGLRRMVRKSAFIRYLIWNRNVEIFGGGQRVVAAPEADLPDCAESQKDIEKKRVLELAAEYIISLLKSELPDKTLIFMSDADRRAIYAGDTVLPVQQNQLFVEEACRRHDCYTLSLRDAFLSDYKKHGRKFNYDIDYHWNPYAHRIIAEELGRFLIENHLLAEY